MRDKLIKVFKEGKFWNDRFNFYQLISYELDYIMENILK